MYYMGMVLLYVHMLSYQLEHVWSQESDLHIVLLVDPTSAAPMLGRVATRCINGASTSLGMLGATRGTGGMPRHVDKTQYCQGQACLHQEDSGAGEGKFHIGQYGA